MGQQKLRHKRVDFSALGVSNEGAPVLIVQPDLNHVLNTLPLPRQSALSPHNSGVSCVLSELERLIAAVSWWWPGMEAGDQASLTATRARNLPPTSMVSSGLISWESSRRGSITGRY